MYICITKSLLCCTLETNTHCKLTICRLKNLKKGIKYLEINLTKDVEDLDTGSTKHC